MHNRSKTSKTSSGAGSDAKEERRKASENNNKHLIHLFSTLRGTHSSAFPYTIHVGCLIKCELKV